MPPLPATEAAQRPPHRWGFGAFLLAEIVFLVASVLVVVPFVLANPSLSEPGAPLPPAALLVSLAIPTVLAAIVGLVATKVRGNGPIIDLRLKFGWRDVGIGAACGVSGVILTIPVGMLWSWWVGEENANSAVGEIFDGLRMNPLLAVLVFVNVWLIAPFCEEILYRGLLWGAMERRRWNRWVILTITTVVFAAAHLELLRFPLLLVIGLPMGLARLFSNRLPAAIIAHQINNFLPALGLMLLLLGVPLTEA
jgi:membrane protease YdiL (CAAX protease family)